MKIFNLPDLGEGLAEAEIVRWHVTTGDHINADDPMLAVETAKAIVEVPSPFSGVIKAMHGNPGDTVATGALLVEFEADTASATAPTTSATAAPYIARATATPSRTPAATRAGHAADSGTVIGTMPTSDDDFVDTHAGGAADGNTGSPDRVRAVPAARALAKRLGIDMAHIRGTGRGSLVTIDDVLQTPAVGTAAVLNGAPHTPGERLRGPRRAMAHSMAISRDNVMGCTLFDDADLHDWHPHQHEHQPPQHQDITSRILRAIAAGCTAEPGLNAWFDGEGPTRRVLTQIDVAIAVDTPEGLIVPVVRNIGGRPVAQLRRDVDRLKRSTHERTVSPEDLCDFTFMLSNFGMIAGRYATPVVVPPAVAILGCGRLSHDVIAIQTSSSSAQTSLRHYPSGNIEVHLRMPLSLTFDHRCVTGGEAARFLAAVIRDLQKGN